MNKNKKWFVALGVATMMTASGLVMAATPAAQQAAGVDGSRRECDGKGDMARKDKRHPMMQDHTALLELLKIDAETFKSEVKAGKTLVEIAKAQGVQEQELKNFFAQHMSKRIDEGVAAGRLSAEQAEKMKANLDTHVSDMINGKGPMHKAGHPGGHPFANEKLLALLKLDAETLRTEMKAGKTLAAVAKEQGVSEKSLKALLRTEMTQRIDEGVKAGRITSDQAKTMKKDLDQRVTDIINGKGPMQRGHGAMHHQGLFNNAELLALLKTDAQTLKGELQAGKTLADVAGDKGVSQQQLKDLLAAQMTKRIDDGVAAGRITADRAAELKAGLDKQLEDVINGKQVKPEHRKSIAF